MVNVEADVVAGPLLALLVLGAGPFEMALLVVSASLAVLLVGFLAGAWVDRVRRRPLLIWADATRAALLFSIPAAYMASVLRIEQLYLVVFLEGCGHWWPLEHPAEAPARVVPSTRRNLGQSRLRVGLAGAGCAGDPRGDRRR